MNKRVLNSLTELERTLVAETEKSAMATLDEDALLELHTRIRRARNKNLKIYRRQASARVADSGGRGQAFPKNQRSRDKAEIFELALARVSRRVEVLAERSAAELKAERLAAARKRPSDPKNGKAPKGGSKAKADRAGTGADTSAVRRAKATKTTGGKKRDASTRAKGARRQAKRDSR
ncbi:hypothetical protein GCM10022204_12030 [Microlunatus aurantiacus]|uniref:50S ribosomal protein L29 n=1 Tax=Microlunatus aurantiacus TaxID=446786 RepID=A0ABP7D0D6_9ACTN